MRAYSASSEEALRARDLLKDWAGEGLLTEAQYQRLEQETVCELRRTNIFLRLVLFLFTLIIVGAAVALFFVLFLSHAATTATGIFLLIFAVICYAAAELADRLRRLVQRTSVQHGGRPVKWLGDGVMFWFRDPGRGVVAALEMADGVVAAGLPPAHVGLHAGPVLFQDGDYYGQTVNMASRIADYARPGEVLVSQAVVDASADAPIGFTEIGPVDLKGVTGTVRVHVARSR